MKRTHTLLLCLLMLSLNAIAQSEPSVNYITAIKRFDLSKLWRASSIVTHSSDGIIDKEPFPFPEPLGYIGSNYQRFYIHYTSVKKDSANPYLYRVKGKTRVKNHSCDFTGTITVLKAVLYKQSDDPRFKEGEVVCKVHFREDSSQAQSGYIRGKLISDWCLDKHNHLHYDAINLVADGYSNNQCTATWTSYATHQSKPCNWGDFRMPNSDKLDTGAGDVSINEQYINNGWQNYVKAYSGCTPVAKRALAEENRQWWK